MNLCIRLLQHQQQAFMKLLRSWIQSCYAGLFLKLFFQTAFPPHTLIHSYHTCGSGDSTHHWAGRQTPTEINNLTDYDPSWTMLGWGKCQKPQLPIRVHGSGNVQQKLWSSWVCLLSTQGPGHQPNPVAKGQEGGSVFRVQLFTTALQICCLSQWWTEWKALCIKRHKKEAT